LVTRTGAREPPAPVPSSFCGGPVPQYTTRVGRGAHWAEAEGSEGSLIWGLLGAVGDGQFLDRDLELCGTTAAPRALWAALPLIGLLDDRSGKRGLKGGKGYPSSCRLACLSCAAVDLLIALCH